MKIEQLIQVIEISRAKSITQAAKNMYMAQSNLSTSIKDLEKELSRPIFIRSEKGMQLTPFGEEFLTQAKVIVKQFDYIRSMADIHNQWSTNFSISSFYFLFASHLFVELFQKNEDNGITFRFEEVSRSQVIHSVYDRTSELGIISLPSTTKNDWLKYMNSHDLEYHTITEEDPFIMIGKGSPLYECTDRTTVSMCELQNLPMIKYEEREKLFETIETHMAPELFKPSSIINISNRDTLIEFLHKTPCYHVSTTNNYVYKRFSYHPGIRSLIISDCPFRFEIGWLKGRNNYLSPLAKEFLVETQRALILEKS